MAPAGLETLGSARSRLECTLEEGPDLGPAHEIEPRPLPVGVNLEEDPSAVVVNCGGAWAPSVMDLLDAPAAPLSVRLSVLRDEVLDASLTRQARDAIDRVLDEDAA